MFPMTPGLAARFELQVTSRPDAPALIHDGVCVTYAELNKRANRVARYLLKAGVKQGTLVGLCLDRSVDLIVGMLGIVKAGGAYLPLDLVYPRERLQFILSDAESPVLVTTSAHRHLFDGLNARVVSLDSEAEAIAAEAESNLEIDHGPDALCYVIYTSGSTGNPKGCMVSQGNVTRLFTATEPWFRFSEKDVWTFFHSHAFDFSVWEIWGALLYGGQLVIVPYSVSRSPDLFRKLAIDTGVTVLNQTPSAFLQFMKADADAGARADFALRLVIFGGEALDLRALAPWVNKYGDQRPQLVNMYGITETTVHVTYRPIAQRDVENNVGSVIGKPIPDLTVHLLDEQLQPVFEGEVGEIFVGGAGVSQGYLKRPELNAQRFIEWRQSSDASLMRLYRSGDLARRLPDGDIEFFGRRDEQIKIRGFRIETGEIEAELAKHPLIRHCAVIAREDRPGEKRLVAYTVCGDDAPSSRELRAFLAETLPDYMVPSAFVSLESLPLTVNGKLDKRALPAPAKHRADLEPPFDEPVTPNETRVCEIFAEVLGLDRVGRLDNFFEFGGDSLLVVQAVQRLKQETGREISTTTFYQDPTPAALTKFVEGDDRAEISSRRLSGSHVGHQRVAANEPIAVIAMAGRFPGARNVERFWENLCEGSESITFFTPEELDSSIPAAVREAPNYVRAKGIIDDVEMFDAAFFGITPKEAELMDPQQRIFLELCWECLERGGYAPDATPVPVGVFGGMNNATYMQKHVAGYPDRIAQLGEFQVMLANEKDFITTRVANRLNLTGPAVSVHTACSTSLVAVVQAVTALRSGQCGMALAGGASVSCPPRSGYLYQEGAMLSPDGHTRSFDADAQGTVFNDGAAVVLLKRLSEAIADGDPIYAVLRGVAINNDGGGKASFTAPSVDGQAAVIAAALNDASVDARTIGYVETHGTATPLGDPVEIEGLTRAFRRHTTDVGFCKIGSVKSNVGHLVIAAGATGLIKTALALHNRHLPASLHFKTPNPKLDLGRTPFVVNAEASPWPANGIPRRAGVSSFGVGGTNAHVVLEEAPAREPSETTSGPSVLQFSARTPKALDRALAQMADHLHADPQLNLADAAYTLRVGRKEFPYRACVVASSAEQAAERIRATNGQYRISGSKSAKVPDTVFMFPGQGSQYAAMGKGLYDTEPIFRDAVDTCLRALEGHVAFDLKARMFSDDAAALVQTVVTQPAIFCLEYALAQLWLSLGVKPYAMIGHSVGEFVAATVAGVFRVEDAIRMVAKRGQLMQELPSGGMLTVRLSVEAVKNRMPAALSLAAENGPELCVVAGPHEAIENFRLQLDRDGVACRLLQTSHAFHSSMMDPAVEPFEEAIKELVLAAPLIPIYSTVTGLALRDDEATNAAYWARHLREPVRFSTAFRKSLENGATLFLELGPRATLSTLAKQHAGRSGVIAIPSVADSPETESESLRLAAGRLWTLGVPVRLESFDCRKHKQRILLPTYPFERLRYWIDAKISPTNDEIASTLNAPGVVPNSSSETLLASISAEVSAMNAPSSMFSPSNRKTQLVVRLRNLFEEVSGIGADEIDPASSFLDLGLDSLTLTQVALQVQQVFGIKVTFRQLMQDYLCLDALAEFLDGQMPPEAAPTPPPPAAAPAPAMPLLSPSPIQSRPTANVAAPSSYVQHVVDAQLQLMSQQLALLRGAVPAGNEQVPAVSASPSGPPQSMPQPAPQAVAVPLRPTSDEEVPAGPIKYDVSKAFGAIARIHANRSDSLTPLQKTRLDAFVRRYNERTKSSKRFTQESRAVMADPRAVTGFRPAIKEIVYPIVVERSKGAYLWDLDGNQYIDALCGFGPCMLGWQPDFVVKAVKDQIDRGFELGPQHPLQAEVARMICEMTGAERAAFCNTGSEAVMGCMRIARTVTGRSLIAIFTGSYHGIFDEVIVRGTKKLKSIPAAPGILPAASQNVLVLDYGTPESLEILKSRANELAAIMVEPVQSRRPDFQPREFLHELRKLTDASGSLLIFDEVVTGFRAGQGGAQEFFGIRADLASYGKVIGGGMPIGVIAGKAQFMDALDGGFWKFGDDSTPPVGVTYFAGTFVRHPLALAAAHAVLTHLKEQGPDLQKNLTERTARFVAELNAFAKQHDAPITVKSFASLWRATWDNDQPFGDLLFYMMRDRGVHLYDGFPCFFTTAHTDADVAKIVQAFKDSLMELIEGGFVAGCLPVAKPSVDPAKPPVPNARMGRDPDGSPAWFVPNPEVPGKYMKLEV